MNTVNVSSRISEQISTQNQVPTIIQLVFLRLIGTPAKASKFDRPLVFVLTQFHCIAKSQFHSEWELELI